MAHVAKYTRSQIGGVTRHYERAQKENGEYQTFGNQDIDASRIHLNYNLAPERDGGQLRFIYERTTPFATTAKSIAVDDGQVQTSDVAEACPSGIVMTHSSDVVAAHPSGVIGVKCQSRENINVMCSWVITLPKTFGDICEVDESGREIYEYDEIDTKIFFREAYRFLNDRYGNGSDKNVISAYVHMDETTPHMHYAFVPVVWDDKKGIEKVSAKAIINRFDLKSFHPDLEKHMAEVFGYEVGILNEATRDGNRSVEELKRGRAQEELSSLKSDISDLRLERQNFASKLQDDINILKDEKNALEGQIEQNKTYLDSLERQVEQNRTHLKPLEEQIGALQTRINPLQQNLIHLTATQTAIDAEYQAKKKYITEAKKSSDISVMYPSYTETSTRGFGKNKKEYVTVPAEKWEEKHISANDVDYLRKMQVSLEKSITDFNRSQSGKSYHAMVDRINDLEDDVNSLEDTIGDLKDENANLRSRIRSYESQLNTKTEEYKEQLSVKDKENESLSKEHKAFIGRVGRTLKRIDNDAAEQFKSEWRAESHTLKQEQLLNDQVIKQEQLLRQQSKDLDWGMER